MTSSTTTSTTTSADTRSGNPQMKFSHKIRVLHRMRHLLTTETRFIDHKHSTVVHDHISAVLAGSRNIPKLTGQEACFKELLFTLSMHDIREQDSKANDTTSTTNKGE